MSLFLLTDRSTDGTLGGLVNGTNAIFTTRYGFSPHTTDSVQVFVGGLLQTPNTSIGAADQDYEIGQFAEIGKIKFETAPLSASKIAVIYYSIGGTI